MSQYDVKFLCKFLDDNFFLIQVLAIGGTGQTLMLLVVCLLSVCKVRSGCLVSVTVYTVQ